MWKGRRAVLARHSSRANSCSHSNGGKSAAGCRAELPRCYDADKTKKKRYGRTEWKDGTHDIWDFLGGAASMLPMGKSLGKGAVWAAMGEQQDCQCKVPQQATQHRCCVRATTASFCECSSLRPTPAPRRLAQSAPAHRQSSPAPGRVHQHRQRRLAGCTSTASAARQAAPAPPDAAATLQLAKDRRSLGTSCGLMQRHCVGLGSPLAGGPQCAA